MKLATLLELAGSARGCDVEQTLGELDASERDVAARLLLGAPLVRDVRIAPSLLRGAL